MSTVTRWTLASSVAVAGVLSIVAARATHTTHRGSLVGGSPSVATTVPSTGESGPSGGLQAPTQLPTASQGGGSVTSGAS